MPIKLNPSHTVLSHGLYRGILPQYQGIFTLLLVYLKLHFSMTPKLFFSDYGEKPPKVIITGRTYDSVTLSFDHFAPEEYNHGYVAMVRITFIRNNQCGRNCLVLLELGINITLNM